MAKLTLEERRLQSLKNQLYGKSTKSSGKKTSNTSHSKFSLVPKAEPKVTESFEPVSEKENVIFLKKDMIKILILSVVAFGTQALLYLGITNNIIKLNNLPLKLGF